MRIALTYDLRDDYRKLGFSEEATAEFDSIETIDAIEQALQQMGHRTERIGNIWKLTEALVAGKRWDLVFNICEGLHGLAREAQVPALLEAYSQPYVFSPPEVLVVAHDKSLAKLKLTQAGLATARWQVVHNESEITTVNLPYPLFAKPVAEGTGKGISAKSLIEKPEDLKGSVYELLQRFRQPVLVETYLPGREFTIGIVGNGHQAEAIGVMEIFSRPGAESGGHTYHNKENWKSLMEYKPVSDTCAEAAGILALAAWRLLGCRDAGRVDIRCDADQTPHFLEVNPLAGLHPVNSDLSILAGFKGIDYQTLLSRVMGAAISRTQSQHTEDSTRCAS